MRFTKDQRDFVTRRELTTIIQPMLDGLKSTIIEEMKEAMNAMESRLRQDSANAIAASADNIFVRAINARIVSRNERLTPVYSLTTGERIPATGKTISELAQLEGAELDELCQALGLPAGSSKARLARTLGLSVRI